MINCSSNLSSLPRPSQAEQAPCGLLNENNRGSISAKVNPETGQANFAENKIRSPVVASSATASPSARPRACSMESASRVSNPSRTTTRSTTTSMSCLNFLSRSGASSIRTISPLILARWKPRRIYSARSFLNSPFRLRTTGAKI